jgi:hypothetical protein
MKIEFPRPNEPMMVNEPGDMIALVHPGADPESARVAVPPQPLPESLRLFWKVEEEGWYTWAYYEGDELYFVGKDTFYLTPGDVYAFTETGWEKIDGQ